MSCVSLGLKSGVLAFLKDWGFREEAENPSGESPIDEAGEQAVDEQEEPAAGG